MAFSIIGIIVGLLVSIGVGAVLRALTRPPQAEAGDIEVPRVEEGTAIPAIFGTVKLGPNIVWWGDVLVEPIKGPRRVFGLVGPRDTVGHRYHVGMQGALCWGQVDELVEIIVGDQYKLSQFGSTTVRTLDGVGNYVDTVTQVVSPSLPVSVVAAGQALTITANNLFGGKEKEGGVSGTVRFYFGSSSQAVNSYLQTNAQSPFPAYPGLCYAAWEQTYLGTVPYLKPWQFVVRRCPTTLGTVAGDTTLSRIGEDANPAEILWELYTDTRWGLARASTDLDQPSFLAALATLSAEVCGVSGVFNSSTADDQAKELLRHIDGVLLQDPTTGLLRLKLIRNDYTVADLLVFDNSNITELTHTRPQMPELLTEVKVNFTDRTADYTTRTRAAYNQALRQSLGRAQSAALSYPWFTTGANAERAAVRDLHAHSAEFATGSMVADRSAAYLALGDPFVIDVPTEGLTSVICRATRIDYGTIHEKETVTVQWAEDVFGSLGGVFAIDPVTPWVPPTGTNAGQRFDVETEFVLSSTDGCLTLRITGDVSDITLIETQTQKGDEAASGWAIQSNSAPITVCVDRADIHPGRIAYRITHTQSDGTTDTIEDEFEVPPRGVYAAPRIDLTIDSTGAVTATVVPDGGAAAEVRAVGDTAGYPADATVDASTADTLTPFVFALGTLAAGATFYVKAVATETGGRASPYATASITRSAAGGSGITGIRPYTIIADPPGQWTVLETFPSALEELGAESHFLYDFRNSADVFLAGVVIDDDGCPGEVRLQYQRADASWNYVDGVGGPALPMDTVGDIEGPSVNPEAAALIGPVWCSLVAVNGDDVASPQIGHVALHSGPGAGAGGDIDGLIPVLGGNGEIPFFYDGRFNVTIETAPSPDVVSAINDARGAAGGTGPPVGSGTSADWPEYDAAEGALKFRGSVAGRQTLESAVFSGVNLNNPLSLVFVGRFIESPTEATRRHYAASVVQQLGGNYALPDDCIGVRVTTAAGGDTLKIAGETRVAGGGFIYEETAVTPGDGLVRCVIVTQDGSTTQSTQVPDDAAASDAMTGAFASADSYICLAGLGNWDVFFGGDRYQCDMLAFFGVTHVLSPTEVAAVMAWAETYRGAVRA